MILSIVTINRNNSEGLSRTLSSLRPIRSNPQIQLIFIDGNSSDGSQELARSFYHHHCFVSEDDQGIYDAMNKGLALATGNFCYWLNSGDELLPDIWTSLKEIISSSRADLLAFSVNFLRSDGGLHRTFVPSSSLLPRQTLAHQGVLFKTEVVKQLGGYRTKFSILADRDLILRIYFSGYRIEYYNLVISNFYIDGISSRHSQVFRENLRVDKEHHLRSSISFFFLMSRNILGQLCRRIIAQRPHK